MIDEYDKAVETALERGESPENYLRFLDDREKREVEDKFQELLARCYEAVKKSAVVTALLLCASIIRADSLSHKDVSPDLLTQSQVALDLEQDSALPMSASVGNILADNLLDAQAAAPYTQFEPDSLGLSIDCVLRAIDLYVWPGGPSAITSAQAEPIVWEQSNIAVDTRVSVSLSPTSIDFGQVAVTPEPQSTFLLAGLVCVVLLFATRKWRRI